MIAVAVALFSVILLIPIIIIVANRAEPDQRGLRPQSVYLFGMSFVSLQLTFAGSVLIVTSLFSVIAPHYSPLTNSVARQVVIGALFVVLFGAALFLHLGRGVESARGDGTVAGPNLRVMQSYVAVVGFIYFLQLVFSLGVAVYLVIALIAPSVFGSFGSDRKGTLALSAGPGVRDAGVGLHRHGPLVDRAVSPAGTSSPRSRRLGPVGPGADWLEFPLNLRPLVGGLRRTWPGPISRQPPPLGHRRLRGSGLKNGSVASP